MLESLLESFFNNRDIKTARSIIEYCNNENLIEIGFLLGKYMCEIYNDIFILSIMGIISYKCKEYKYSYSLYDRILEFNNLDEIASNMMLNNQIASIKYISDEYIHYNSEIVKGIMSREESKFPMITFTVTTCKRYDLFEKTMNSFLNCCEDVNKIDKWLCVDDNSSEEDRDKMKKNYPFFEFYFKTKGEKGHPQSMNIIRKKVTTPYMFHIEDDWKFVSRKKYIELCLYVLNQDLNIGQCLINKNYAEIDSVKIVGGIYKVTDSGKRYYIHEHCGNKQDYDKFNAKYGGQSNCAYWPYFSFRPSLMRTEIIKKIGKFDETVAHFEMEYSNRYKNAGYTSAFLEGLYCLHIGRLTSERNDNNRENAYVLNDEKQFGNKDVDKVNINMKTYVINLDRRKDRWDMFQKQKEPKCLMYERFAAVDGSRLEKTEQLQRIFDGNDYNMREGMVGCAMSHIKLYIELVNSKYDSYCILEDDLDFVPDFKNKFLEVYKSLPEGWDMCYLGHHLWKQYRSDDMYDKNKMPEVEKWNTVKSLKYSMGGTGGYIISKKGAKNLLEYINSVGMTNGIDTMQQKAADSMNIYYCKPHLIYSECCTYDKKTDTDIQYNHTSLTVPIKSREEYEENFYSEFGKVVKTDVEPDFENVKDITFYRGSNIRDCLKRCKLPCYSLNYEVMIIVPYTNDKIKKERYFERLKKNDSWNIDDALNIKKKLNLISFGGAHVFDVLKSVDSTLAEYPFDTMYGGNFDVYLLLSEMILNMTDDEIEKFTKEFFDIEKNMSYIQSYNNKEVFKNISYNISFPHEDIKDLVDIYMKRFKNFRNTLKEKIPIKFIYCTRWEKEDINKVYYGIDLFKKYNSNLHIVIINAIDISENIEEKYKLNLSIEHVEFPKEYHNHDDWTFEKVLYDQTTFRDNVMEKIKKYI